MSALQFDFDGANLVRAMEVTFRRRRAVLPNELPIGLSIDFVSAPANYRSGTRSFAGVD
jgi:hypothetical protein